MYSIQNEKNEDQKLSSKSRIINKPVINIKITDKKIIGNLLLMCKTITKGSSTIILRINKEPYNELLKLYIYSNSESEDKIRYVLLLDPTLIDSTNLDKICIYMSYFFAEFLENYLIQESTLNIQIDFQKFVLRLVSPETLCTIKFTPTAHKFDFFKNPEQNFDFKIAHDKLEKVRGFLSNEKNTKSKLYFNTEKFKFVFNTGYHIINTNQYGIEVNNEAFVELVKKHLKKNHDPKKFPLSSVCLSFELCQNILNYFSIGTSIVKNSKKGKRDKNVEVNNACLQISEKIYFKLKELSQNRNEEESFITPAEISISAVRKHSGKIIEEFYFDSRTDINIYSSNQIFKSEDDDFVLMKNDIEAFNKSNVSSFLIFGTSQNIFIPPKQMKNNNKSLLVEAKIEGDDDNEQNNLNSHVVNDRTLSIVQSNNLHEDSSISVKYFPKKQSLQLLIENPEESLEESYDYNNNKDNLILNNLSGNNNPNSNMNINQIKNNIISIDANNLSSRGGCNMNSNTHNNNIQKIIQNNHNSKTNNSLHSIQEHDRNVKFQDAKNQLYPNRSTNNNINPNQSKNIPLNSKNYINPGQTSIKQEEPNSISTFKSNHVHTDQRMNSPFCINNSSIKPVGNASDHNLLSTYQNSVVNVASNIDNKQIENKKSANYNPFLKNNNINPFTGNEVKQHVNPFTKANINNQNDKNLNTNVNSKLTINVSKNNHDYLDISKLIKKE